MINLDGQAEDFRWHLEHAEPGSALEECARWGLNLVAELRVARRVIDLERPQCRPVCSSLCPCERNQAWLAYEKAVQA